MLRFEEDDHSACNFYFCLLLYIQSNFLLEMFFTWYTLP